MQKQGGKVDADATMAELKDWQFDSSHAAVVRAQRGGPTMSPLRGRRLVALDFASVAVHGSECATAVALATASAEVSLAESMVSPECGVHEANCGPSGIHRPFLSIR